MTSASFESRHIHQAGTFTPPDVPVCAVPEGATQVHADEARRMKDYAGQRRFQAPVADDFARGMLAPGQAGTEERELLTSLRGTLRSMVKQVKALWRG